MTPIECIKTRRSIRNFTNTPISHSVLSEIVEAASYAPSWKNTQITRYIAIEDSAKKAQIAEECTNIYKNNGEIIKRSAMLIAVTIIKNRSGFERDGSFSTPKGTGWHRTSASQSLFLRQKGLAGRCTMPGLLLKLFALLHGKKGLVLLF